VQALTGTRPSEIEISWTIHDLLLDWRRRDTYHRTRDLMNAALAVSSIRSLTRSARLRGRVARDRPPWPADGSRQMTMSAAASGDYRGRVPSPGLAEDSVGVMSR
jgi:hypothetical protein